MHFFVQFCLAAANSQQSIEVKNDNMDMLWQLHKDLNFLLQGLLHNSTLLFQKGAINPLMEYLIILVFGCSTYDVTRVVCCVCKQRADGVQINTLKLPLFKLSRVRYPRHDRRGWSLPRVE